MAEKPEVQDSRANQWLGPEVLSMDLWAPRFPIFVATDPQWGAAGWLEILFTPLWGETRKTVTRDLKKKGKHGNEERTHKNSQMDNPVDTPHLHFYG